MKLNLSGVEVKAARVLVGMKGHRPSGFNACIGNEMRGKTYAKPAPGMGGRHNAQVHRDFISAAIKCGAKVGGGARSRA